MTLEEYDEFVKPIEAEISTLKQQLAELQQSQARAASMVNLLCGRWRRLDGTIYAPVKKS